MMTGNKFSAAGDKKKTTKKAGSSGNPSRHSWLIRLLLETKRLALGYHHPSPAMKDLNGDKIYCLVATPFKSLQGWGASNLC